MVKRTSTRRKLKSEKYPPFLSMLWAPRRTIRRVIAEDPRRGIKGLAMLLGLSWAFAQAAGGALGDKLRTPVLWVAIVGGGSLVGIGLMYLMGPVLRATAGLLEGKAPLEHVRAAYVWSWVPNISVLPIWFLLLIFFGGEVFSTVQPRFAPGGFLGLAFQIFVLIDVAMGIWSFNLLIVSLRAVEGFSTWKAASTVILALLAMVVVFMLPIVLLAAFLR